MEGDFTEWIPVRYANLFCEAIEQKCKDVEEGITLEFFPNKTRIKPGKFGQAIKLPYGVHVRTGEKSYFLDDDFLPVKEIDAFFDNIAKYPLSTIKKILALNLGVKEKQKEKCVDMNLEAFGTISLNIREVLEKCNLMHYLCQKAVKTGYLTHFERLSILYVFGHLGEEGKQFVHTVMECTLNYQYQTTERFIQKIPAKPISCIKLREQYKQITAEYGCSCVFKRNKNCYPSPVLHVISLSTNLQTDITIPTSRTLTKEKEKKIFDEINIYKKTQELAVKILGMKKQKRGLDSAISRIERELEGIYDSAGIDCLEIEMGMLVRRKIENGYEWLIEI